MVIPSHPVRFAVLVLVAGTIVLVSTALLFGAQTATPPANDTLRLTNGWATASPASVGLDELVLFGLDKDISSGKYSQIIDSLAVFRCGKKVFERTYPRDYAKIYNKEAGKRGPYNMRLNGRYNYFDSYWHPYYHGTDLHTMQSITKTITGVILGAAVQRGDFKASLETPVLKYFDPTKLKNVDDRKRRVTLRDLLNMTTGFEWDAGGFEYTGDPKNDTSQMEGSDDWVQYAIDKPMVAEPGKVFNYNDGAAVLLAYVFQKETDWDIDDYAQKYLFGPLGMRHEWKRTYLGVVDAEGGLYLNGSDLAKIGYLYLNDGVWEGQRIVSSEWVKQSLSHSIQDDEPDIVSGKVVGTIHFRYGFLWTFFKPADSTEYVWLGEGFGGQHLELFPQEGLIVTFTGWDFDPSSTNPSPSDFLAAVKTKTCLDSTDGLASTSEKQQASKQGSRNPEAYALYLKGRSYWAKQTRADLETAASYFNQAIAKDPGYAMAYAGLADAYAVLPDYGPDPSEYIPKAKAAALKAIELDPSLSRPHVNLGGIKMAHDWDFAGGEAEFKKALELDPNDTHAHERYADNLGVLGGREQEALAEINRAHHLDPLSPDISYDLGLIHIYARRFDEAIAVCKKLANENSTYAGAHDCLANAYWRKRMYSQSLEEFKVEIQLSGDRNESERASAMEQGFRSGGWQGALSKSIETLKAQRKTQPSSAYGDAYAIAAAYAELGDKEQAFQWLNTAFQEHDEYLMGLKTDSSLDSLRSDPRFAVLERKVGLPQ